MQSKKQTIVLAFTIVACFAVVIALSRYMDANRPKLDSNIEEENLYVAGNTAKKMSLGFNGLVADWYWMRSLQYIGRKLINHKGDLQIDNLTALNPKLLYPLLDNATTLDPDFTAVYEYGAIVLPTINKDDAIKLVKKGIEANPADWKLYHQLGYIYWKSGDFKSASKTYLDGSKLPFAPPWMRVMSARIEGEGGSRQTAREMFTNMLNESSDRQIKELAAKRLLQIESFDERDEIQKVILSFQERAKRCPSSWLEITNNLSGVTLPTGRKLRIASNGTPVDPLDTPYLLVQKNCHVDLDWNNSKIPYK